MRLTASLDDTESIAMLTARGLVKCPHTTCGYFLTTLIPPPRHLEYKHRCFDPGSCPGCIGPIKQDEPKKYECKHECTKDYNDKESMFEHCKALHGCNHTYGACPNTRAYRCLRFYAPPGDTQSVKRFLDDRFVGCDHSECIYFFKSVASKKLHMKLMHKCSDPQRCKGCQEGGMFVDGPNIVLSRVVISGTVLPKLNPPSRKKIRTTTSNNSSNQQNNIDMWSEGTFNVIKCPHVGCEEYGQPRMINQHLRLPHKCPVSQQQQHCDGCKLSRNCDHQHDWLLV
ncbi:hypothetical protein SAMD00019534_054440 [Acytostelium subglobosum LB1]|uniref:hypothetical protein n=1 Tax=Acytostelium subglobosum LB1 TaxID=1410327 RepID=UPI00064521AB|nr:hypothetical protein SAMD00019534_054440 [Acytostelium subglobosum LB1]GAM22269.1 hypothetical protein SAMD00019534_054440 [Acytostelium subglobosum LB1]|eukprot:XP_012754389.1 hypothetical protein SAMD00019534_054440 [Acytostelium subglobosum LB1]